MTEKILEQAYRREDMTIITRHRELFNTETCISSKYYSIPLINTLLAIGYQLNSRDYIDRKFYHFLDKEFILPFFNDLAYWEKRGLIWVDNSLFNEVLRQELLDASTVNGLGPGVLDKYRKYFLWQPFRYPHHRYDRAYLEKYLEINENVYDEMLFLDPPTIKNLTSASAVGYYNDLLKLKLLTLSGTEKIIDLVRTVVIDEANRGNNPKLIYDYNTFFEGYTYHNYGSANGAPDVPSLSIVEAIENVSGKKATLMFNRTGGITGASLNIYLQYTKSARVSIYKLLPDIVNLLLNQNDGAAAVTPYLKEISLHSIVPRIRLSFLTPALTQFLTDNRIFYIPKIKDADIIPENFDKMETYLYGSHHLLIKAIFLLSYKTGDLSYLRKYLQKGLFREINFFNRLFHTDIYLLFKEYQVPLKDSSLKSMILSLENARYLYDTLSSTERLTMSIRNDLSEKFKELLLEDATKNNNISLIQDYNYLFIKDTEVPVYLEGGEFCYNSKITAFFSPRKLPENFFHSGNVFNSTDFFKDQEFPLMCPPVFLYYNSRGLLLEHKYLTGRPRYILSFNNEDVTTGGKFGIPVFRIDNLYHQSHIIDGGPQGTFFFFEPESPMYLRFNTYLFAKGKLEAYQQLFQNFLIKRITSDGFDEQIAAEASKQGYDIVIFQEVSGDALDRVSTEILDTRGRRTCYKHLSRRNSAILFPFALNNPNLWTPKIGFIEKIFFNFFYKKCQICHRRLLAPLAIATFLICRRAAKRILRSRFPKGILII